MKSCFQWELNTRSWKAGYFTVVITNLYDSCMSIKHISDFFFYRRLFGFTNSRIHFLFIIQWSTFTLRHFAGLETLFHCYSLPHCAAHINLELLSNQIFPCAVCGWIPLLLKQMGMMLLSYSLTNQSSSSPCWAYSLTRRSLSQHPAANTSAVWAQLNWSKTS